MDAAAEALIVDVTPDECVVDDESDMSCEESTVLEGVAREGWSISRGRLIRVSFGYWEVYP